MLAQVALHALDRYEGPVALPPNNDIPITIRRHRAGGQLIIDRTSAVHWVLNVSASAASAGRLAVPSAYNREHQMTLHEGRTRAARTF